MVPFHEIRLSATIYSEAGNRESMPTQLASVVIKFQSPEPGHASLKSCGGRSICRDGATPRASTKIITLRPLWGRELLTSAGPDWVRQADRGSTLLIIATKSCENVWFECKLRRLPNGSKTAAPNPALTQNPPGWFLCQTDAARTASGRKPRANRKV